MQDVNVSHFPLCQLEVLENVVWVAEDCVLLMHRISKVTKKWWNQSSVLCKPSMDFKQATSALKMY